MNTFPVGIDKAPLTPNGLYDARPDDEWDGTMYDSHKQWGMPCGALNGVIAVDVDAKSGGLASAAALDLPATYRQETPGGGYHLFYKWTGDCEGIKNAVGVMPGIDIRSEGGYVVLYKKPDLTSLATPPKWLIDQLKQPLPPLILAGDDEVGEGGRNAYLTRAAGRLQRASVLTLASLEELNERKCVPALPQYEVERIFVNVSKYKPASTPLDDELPVQRVKWAGEYVKDFLDYLKNKDQVIGKPTGLVDLDKLLGGGKRLGELTVTLAQGKTGKNTLYHQMMLPWLNEGIAIGYCSREISPENEVLPNLLTLALGKNMYKALNIEVADILTAISKWKLAFSNGYGAMYEGELFQWMDELRAHDVKYFFIDHLHYMMIDSEDFKAAALFMRQLKTYCKTHNVHCDLIIQPKNQEAGTRLGLSSLRGGAALGQTLDTLITMERMRDNAGELINVVKVSVEAARSKLAKTGSFYLGYDTESMVFSPVEPVEAGNETDFPAPPKQTETPPKTYGVITSRPPTIMTNGKPAPTSNDIFGGTRRAADKLLKGVKHEF